MENNSQSDGRIISESGSDPLSVPLKSAPVARVDVLEKAADELLGQDGREPDLNAGDQVRGLAKVLRELSHGTDRAFLRTFREALEMKSPNHHLTKFRQGYTSWVLESGKIQEG